MGLHVSCYAFIDPEVVGQTLRLEASWSEMPECDKVTLAGGAVQYDCLNVGGVDQPEMLTSSFADLIYRWRICGNGFAFPCSKHMTTNEKSL